jgi:dephospho-CoA kinase
MLIIGLVGGIASGKSAVATELAKLGATVFNADEAAHRVINEPTVKEMLVERWGPEVLQANGEVDRKAVAKQVFSFDLSSAQERLFLEELLHPHIRTEFEAKLAMLQLANVPAIVIDAPLLLEAGWGKICDVVLFVDSPREDCKKRAETLRNWTPSDFAAREAAQMPIEEKRRLATHVLANDGTLEVLQKRVGEFWQSVIDKSKTS